MSTKPLTYSTSAALLFTEQELGGPCTEQESYPIALSTSSTVIAQGNGDRVGLVIINLGPRDCYVGLQGTVSSTTGIYVPTGGGSISLTVRDDFTLPARQWSAIGVSGSTQLYVLEIIRYTSLELSQS